MKKACLIVVLTFLFICPFGAQAQEKSWFFDKWEVGIRINKDSTFVVQEAQTFNFTGNYHWVTRTLVKTKGIRYADIKVYETDKTRLTGSQIEITDTSSDVEIKVNFDLTDTSHTWIFEYTVIGGIGFFADYDELYWNAVSSDRDVTINSAQVSVYLPEAVDPAKIQQKIYLGYTGSTQESTDYISGTQELNFFATDIAAYDNFTIVAGWPKGIVDSPGYWNIESKPKGADIFIDGQAREMTTPEVLLVGYDIPAGPHQITLSKFGYQDCAQTLTATKGEDQSVSCELVQKRWYTVGVAVLKILLLIYLISPVFLFIWLYFRWKKFGRDPGEKKTIIAQYEPPDKIRPAEMGVLIDERADSWDITATIIDLAYRGYIRIYEEEDKILFGHTKKYRFELLKNKDDSSLKEYERILLAGMFEDGKMVSLTDLKYTFYQTLDKIKKSLYQETTVLGYFESNPETVRKKYLVIGAVVMVLGAALLGVPIVWGLMIMIFGYFMPKKTIKGAETKWWADGFKLYLYTAERFRLNQVTPETFEKYLSYAMVFKVERQWAERFADIYKQAPNWYVSAGGVRAFVLADFASNISSGFSSAVASGLASHPSSSSGFGGGGFSGGGGGGGGSGAG